MSEKEEIQQILNKRNTASVQQSIDQLSQKIYDQDAKINGLLQTITTLNERVNALEQLTKLQKVLLTGRGPTAV